MKEPDVSEEKTGMTFTREDATAGLPEEIRDEPVGPMIGVATIALNMALKYHDINTVQDGTLYQQYKLEGRNMRTLHLDEVFHTAIHIEQHLIAANRRVARMMVPAALEDASEAKGVAPDVEGEEGQTQQEPPKP